MASTAQQAHPNEIGRLSFWCDCCAVLAMATGFFSL
jgi:hypothetical protein